jgi:hypothetical protein
MVWKYFLAAAVIFQVSAANAEEQPLGPVDATVTLNGTQIPFQARSAVDVTSRGGQFNLVGSVTVTSQTAVLQQRAAVILPALLPARLPMPVCELRITGISDLRLISQDNEAQISGTATLKLTCGGINDAEDVPFKIALMPDIRDKRTISAKLVRDPDIKLPWLWKAALGVAKGNSAKFLRKALQDALSAHAVLTIPPIDGVSDAFQGANIDGDADNISLRIKGDVHASGSTVTKLFQQLRSNQPISLSFNLPAH